MSESTPRLWFSDTGTSFTGTEPFFFDTATLPWVGIVESQWTTIRDELRAFVLCQPDQLRPYLDVTMASNPNRWRTFGLMFWTQKNDGNCAKFPRTCAILSGIPNLIAASFNLLEEKTTIKAHSGNTNAIFRCHLGLEIPSAAPQCAFRVGTEVRSWEPGKLMVFCDAHNHTAWNNAGADRYVLVIDVMRPEFAHRTRYVASRVLAAIYVDAAYQKIATLRTFCSSGLARMAVFKLFRLSYATRLLLHALRRF